MKNEKTKNQQCTWAVNNFPRHLKDRYAAYLKSNRVTIRDHLEYLISKTLREAGVDIPKIEIESVVERIRNKAGDLSR